jgi:hypothetical protein
MQRPPLSSTDFSGGQRSVLIKLPSWKGSISSYYVHLFQFSDESCTKSLTASWGIFRWWSLSHLHLSGLSRLKLLTQTTWRCVDSQAEKMLVINRSWENFECSWEIFKRELLKGERKGQNTRSTEEPSSRWTYGLIHCSLYVTSKLKSIFNEIN